MKAKAKREGPLKIPMRFDDAIKCALQVKPPSGGWSALDRGLTQKRKRKPAK